MSYIHTSKGYKFVEYEAPEPPRDSVYDRVIAGIHRRGRDAATAYPGRPRNPYARADYALAWEEAFEYEYQHIHDAVMEFEARLAGRAALEGNE